MTRDEFEREAAMLVDLLGCDTGRGEIDEAARVLARIHAAGLAQGRAEMRERAARVAWDPRSPDLAREIRALPDMSEESERG